MPPRFAYWTILIDGQPTAFRARDQQDLLPTLTQLKRTNKDVLLRWFARGRLWESQQQDFDARRQRKAPSAAASRGRDWRPGGQHADPRARFNKKGAAPRPDRERTRTPRRPPSTGEPPGAPRKPAGRPPGQSAGAPRKAAGRRFGNRPPPGGRGRKR
jgi:hypothetical protein